MNYSDLNLKTKRAFSSKLFKEKNITIDNIGKEKLRKINEILSRGLTVDRRKAFENMIITETLLENDLLIRFERYCSTSANTEDHFRLKFGDEVGFEKYKRSNKNRGNGNTLEGQIAKYGFEEGTKRHQEMNSKKSHTLENFIRKYGEQKGEKMFENTMSKKGLSLEKMINVHGEELGKKKWASWKEKCTSNEENFIRRHGEEIGKQKWIEFKNKSKSTKENFIRRHGEKLGLEKWEIYRSKISNTKENFIRVHGENEGQLRWKKYKNSNAGYFASQESLEFFKLLVNFLMERDIDFTDIFFGADNSFEFKIETEDKVHSYDFTILSLKLIFEYNGSHVHPSKDNLSEEKWVKWKCAWTEESADEKFIIDQQKLKVAKEAGFTVFEIWDYEAKSDFNKTFKKCIDLIESSITKNITQT